MRSGILPTLDPDGIIGRDHQYAEIQTLISRSPWVGVVGPGGIGKSRFAQMVAERWSLDVAFIDLRSAQTETDAESFILRALASIGGTGETLSDQLQTSGVSMVVLDHIDLVSTWVSEHAKTIREHARLISTSRAVVAGSTVYTLPPLDEASAAQLFVRVLSNAGRDADVDDPQLRRIVRRLDGLPLAIELAAAEARRIAFADFADYLDDAYEDLGDGDVWKTGQQNLRATFQRSWDALPDDLRPALCHLSFHVGRFTTDDAKALLELPKAQTIKTLARLTDQSMVSNEFVGDESQYQILEPIRVLALKFFETESPQLFRESVKRYANRWLDTPYDRRATSVISLFKQTGEVDPELAVTLAIRALTPVHFRHERASRFLVDRVFALCESDELSAQRLTLHCLAAELFASEWSDFSTAAEHIRHANALASTEDELQRVALAEARVMMARGDDRDALSALRDAGATPTELGACALRAGALDEAIAFTEGLDTFQPFTILTIARAIQSDILDVDRAISMAKNHPDEVERQRSLLWFQRLSPATLIPGLQPTNLDPKLDAEVALAVAERDRDIDSLLHLSGLDFTWSKLAARHATVLVSTLSLRRDRPLEGLEHARRALTMCDENEERAWVMTLAVECATRAGKTDDATFLRERVTTLETDLGRDVRALEEPSRTELFRIRAERQHRVSLWSWVAWVDLLRPFTRLDESAPPEVVWKVSDEARWVQTPADKMLNLSRRGPMRKLLWYLVQKRIAEPGVGTDVNDIFDVAWPGETIDYELMLARVYNTIRALRGLGFEDVVLTHDDGYLLDPNVAFEIV